MPITINLSNPKGVITKPRTNCYRHRNLGRAAKPNELKKERKMTEVLLINKTKKPDPELRDTDLQEANARDQADQRIRENSATNPLYIVTVADPTITAKKRKFFGLKLRDQSAIYLEVIGIEIEIDTQLEAVKSYSDVQALARLEDTAVISIRFPWARVINIENKTYKHKKV